MLVETTFKIWKLFVIIILVEFMESANAADIVLDGGLDAYQGHVVFLADPNHASSVCFHTGSGLENFARVVCRQFGTFGGHAGPSLRGTRAAFLPSIAISHNGCRGTEPSILDCEHTETTNCTEGLDYIVHCSRDPNVHRGIRMVEGGVVEGFVELYYHGKWVRMKEEVGGNGRAEAVMHQVACRQLGLSGGISVDNGTTGNETAEGYALVRCDSPAYTSLYQCFIKDDHSPAPSVWLQCSRPSPDMLVEAVLPASHTSQGLHFDNLLHLSSTDRLIFEVQTCSGLKLRLFPTGSSENSSTEVIVDKLIPSRVKTQIVLRECEDYYHCRSTIVLRSQADRLLQCNDSNYPSDHAPWVRMSLNVRQLIDSGVLHVSVWSLPQNASLSSWIETLAVDRKSFRLVFSTPPRLLKFLEISSTDHQVAFRVPRDGTINKCLVTKAEWEGGLVAQCGDDYVDDEDLCVIQCGCCFDANRLRSNGPSCFHPIAIASPVSPKSCNRPFATLHGLIVILDNCPCNANSDATFIVLIQHFSSRLVAMLDPGTGEKKELVVFENDPKRPLPQWAANRLNSVLITGVTEFARGMVTHRYLSKGNFSATLLLSGSRAGSAVSTFQVAVKIAKRQSLRDIVQNVTFVNNGPTRCNHKVSFFVALPAVSAQMQVTLQHKKFIMSLVTLDQSTPIPDWAQRRVGNASNLKYRALIESSYDNPGLYKPSLILSDLNFEDVIYRVDTVKVWSSEELLGGVYLLTEGAAGRHSNTITFALLVERITNATGATISFGDGSMARPHLNRITKDLPQWVGNELASRWKNPFAVYGSLTTHMFWSPEKYHVRAEVNYDQNSIDDPVMAEVVVTVTCNIELTLTGGGRDLENVVTYNKGDNFVIAAAVSLTCARDELRSVGWNVYFLKQSSGSPFPVTDESPDPSNRLDDDEVDRIFIAQEILFRVPSFSLRYGIYVFEINVTSTSGAHQLVSSWVFIRPVDIGVQLSGQVYLRTGLNENIKFEVVGQVDPDESPQSPISPVVYQWLCVQGIGMLTPELLQSETGGCFGRGTNVSTDSHFLAFNTSDLKYHTLPQLFTFWVVALKGVRGGYDHRFLELLPNVTAPVAQSPQLPSDIDDPILVDIVCLSNCLASLDLTTEFSLMAVCRNCPPDEDLVYRWRLTPRDANSTIGEFNFMERGIADDSRTLTIVRFLLGIFYQVQKMELYQLKVTVTRPNRQSQDAVYVFAVGVASDSGESGRMDEVKSSASATVLVKICRRDFSVQLVATSCVIFIIVTSYSTPWSTIYEYTIIRLLVIFSIGVWAGNLFGGDKGSICHP